MIHRLLAEWQNWWRSLSMGARVGPFVGVIIYWIINAWYGGFRSDHLNSGLILLILYYSGPRLWPILKYLFPLLLTAIIYDSMRMWGDFVRGRIRIEEPYHFDLRFFGIEEGGKKFTPNEWFQLHTNPALDFITGLFYLVFVPLYALHGAYIRFWLTKKGTAFLTPTQVEERTRQFMWCFFWVNMLGYSTYYWYPAAPPWYVSTYGLGPVNMNVRPSAAGCVRFDDLLGTHFFKGWYGRSNDVFGAIPSLHVAYPFLSLLFSFRIRATRTFGVLFYGVMCVAAVYLNHHYVLDVLWGTTYAALIFYFVGYERFRRKALPANLSTSF